MLCQDADDLLFREPLSLYLGADANPIRGIIPGAGQSAVDNQYITTINYRSNAWRIIRVGGSLMKLNGFDVFRRTLRNKFRKYPDQKDPRYRNHIILPHFEPSFHISRQSSVFTIGSCFAREIEGYLLRQGVAVPTSRFTAPPEEAPGYANRILNQYNPGTMLQCIDFAGQPAVDCGLYEVGDGQVQDCLLATGGRPVSRARAMERRAQINTLYAEGLQASDTVVITLGLIEAWYDRETGLFLNELPPPKKLKAQKSRFEFKRMNVHDVEKIVAEMIEKLSNDRRRNIILTVSPVPLQTTFSGGDAVVANAYSKSILRVVVETMSKQFPNVDYFPSYEIVTTAGLRALGPDNIHVRPAVVGEIVKHMMSGYLK